MNNSEQIIEINPYEVRVMVHRERDPDKFERFKQSIAKIGIQQPVQVRDISALPAKDRRRKDGGLFKWELHFGEGRTTAMIQLYEETKDRRFLKLPAIVKQLPENEMAGAFLSENLLRRDHAWLDQAKLIRADVNRGMSLKEISDNYFITERHAKKLIHIIDVASHRLKKQLKEMTLKEATVMTSLPAKSQEIVLDTLKEAKLDNTQIQHVVKKAKELHAIGDLSKTALKASLRRVGEDLSRVRDRLKLNRLHHSLGPQNLEFLLEDKTFRAELDRLGINYPKFLEAVS